MKPANLEKLVLLVAAIHAYDRAHTAQHCPDCGATWEGDPDCSWCAEAAIRQHDEQRRILLTPPDTDHGPRYDELDDIDKAIWDRTRGNDGEGSMVAWAERLGRAVEAGVVTQREADTALRRAGRTAA